MSKFNMVADHAIRPVEEDIIFGANMEAQRAIKEVGFDKVINSTIGALLDDNGKLITFKSVFEILRSLSDEGFAAYAPLRGLPSYLDASIKATFGDYKPQGYIQAVATPGGSGAIRHAIWNYTNLGDEILTSDWYWAPYNTLASEHGRKVATYTLFDDHGNFNSESFGNQVDALLEKQKRVLIIINSPAHNPTGFTLSVEQWKDIIEIVKEKSINQQHRIILFVDAAYIDFCDDDTRQFFLLLGNLPYNILSIVAFSMSKGYTFYGLRSGAIIGISSDEEIANEFKNVCSYSNRGVWSSGTRSAMEVLIKIYEDQEVLHRVQGERAHYRDVLNKRAEAFVTNAEDIELGICPYKDGFFISIPCNDPIKLSKELQKDHAFLVPLKKGLRFAACSVSLEKCNITPKLIKDAMLRLK
ncbi:MAG: pyridoxal phosphate-dependent aminotransferase [Eubacteriales bacterium]